MYKSILAISEGGPDAAMSFGLAARIASMFDATVDAVHFSESRLHDVDIAAQAMPFLKAEAGARLKARAAESERAFRELIAPIDGATFTGGPDVTLDQLEAEHIRLTLDRTRTRDDAARILGIDPSTLYRKRRQLGL